MKGVLKLRTPSEAKKKKVLDVYIHRSVKNKVLLWLWVLTFCSNPSHGFYEQEHGKQQLLHGALPGWSDNKASYFSLWFIYLRCFRLSAASNLCCSLTRDRHPAPLACKKTRNILTSLFSAFRCILSATLGSFVGLAVQHCLFPHLSSLDPEYTQIRRSNPRPHERAAGMGLFNQHHRGEESVKRRAGWHDQHLITQPTLLFSGEHRLLPPLTVWSKYFVTFDNYWYVSATHESLMMSSFSLALFCVALHLFYISV